MSASNRLKVFRESRFLGATFTEPCIPALMLTQVGIRNVPMNRKQMASYELSLRTPNLAAARAHLEKSIIVSGGSK